MAAEAVGAFLTAMGILMAVGTLASQSKKRLVQILHLDLRSGADGDVFRRVTLLAVERRVFSLEREAGLRSMIEGLPIQADEREFLAVMLHMTASAVGLTG